MKKGLHDSRRCAKVAGILKTLAHPQRLRVFCCLCDGEYTVGELQEACDTSQSLISQYLARMRHEGLVQSRRDGTSVHYRVADPQLAALMASMEKIFNE